MKISRFNIIFVCLFFSESLFAACVTNNSSLLNSSLVSISAGGCVDNFDLIEISDSAPLATSGILSTHANVLITNKNTGIIANYAEFGSGISSTGQNNTILNEGLISTLGEYGWGIQSTDQGTSNINLDTITTLGGSAAGIYATGGNSINENHYLISTNGDNGHGIASEGPNTINRNFGTITTYGEYGWGINSGGSNSVNTNSGSIQTFGQSGYGIYSLGSNSTISNSGFILTVGEYGYGILTAGTSNLISNIGTINVSGEASAGIFLSAINAVVTNAGAISASGISGHAISINNSSNSVSNTGLIQATGDSGYGIALFESDNQITNFGTIKALGANSSAIYLFNGANNNTINLNRGSIIVGDIVADSSTTGNSLNINLGAGASYAYSVTGPFTVSDLDNRPMVTGSAYAAGIGAQETASEMLYQRTSAITSALDRRNRSYNADYLQNQPYWLDVYYADVTRHSGGNYSTQTAFANHNYGMTAGFKLAEQYTPLELVVSVEQSKLNIDSGNQKIDSTSLMAGLSVPNLAEVLGTRLSAKAMVGYADHDGDRKVMTNSLLYDGSRQIKSDYKSHAVLLGAALNKPFELSDHLVADVLIGVDYTAQRVRAYSEEDYFAWDKRTLSQVQSRVQLGLEGFFFNNRGSVFGQLGAEHRDLIGGATQGYSINGTSVSFNTDNKNDTYLTAQMGMKIQLDKRVQLFGLVNKLHSSDSVDSLSGNIGLRADF